MPVNDFAEQVKVIQVSPVSTVTVFGPDDKDRFQVIFATISRPALGPAQLSDPSSGVNAAQLFQHGPLACVLTQYSIRLAQVCGLWFI
jgi:hypothetical protein